MPEEVVSTAPAEAPVIPAAGTPAPAAPAEGSPQAAETPGSEAPTAKPDETPVETPEQAAERKTQQKIERSIAKATRRYYAEKARADFLQKQLAERAPEAAPVDSGRPKVDQFSDIEEYAKAVGKYEREQGIKEYEAKQQAESERRAQERISSEWDKKAERGSSKYDDFEQVVGELEPTSPILRAIMDAENAEDVAYYLAKNRVEAARIMSLDVISQVRAIGKLEAKLLAEPPKPKTPSAAPVPIKPVGGSNSPPTKKLSEMTQDEFEKKRKAQIAARR